MTTIKNFYANKTIFITGASGFLGICLLEKILRSMPDHGRIYLLLRPKKGKQISERLEEIHKNQIFEKLLEKESVNQVFKDVFAIAGDVAQDNLGLSPADRKLLTDNVNVIFHSAATLDFGETLKTTINVNLLGTRRVVQLGKECRNLYALVQVSSAYVNSYKLEAEEVIYDLKRDPDELISILDISSDEELREKTPELLGDHPNTYTITKHMAEHEIKKAQTNFPCAIVRPSMIIGAWKEPVPGWTNSKNGPQGFLMGAAKGVVRRLPVAKHLIYDYIPVDIVVNTLIAAAFYVGSTKPNVVQIYHATSSTRNPFSWSVVEDKVNTYIHEFPIKSAVWYPHLKFLPSITWYKISAIFIHFIPAFFLDLITKLSGGRPILMKLHRNVNSSLTRLEKFIFTEWKFHAVKTEDLHEFLSKGDREEFNLNISDLNWVEYFRDLSLGARIYLNKEPIKNLASAKAKDNILMILNWALQAILLSLLWYFFACITNMSMSGSIFIVPVAFILFNLL